MDLKNKILNYKNDVINSIQELIRIKSVQEQPQHNMPFGYGPTKALEWCFNKAKEFGFKVTNYNNYVVEIEYGNGNESLGILCHVDVVPEGDNWDFDPYQGVIHNNKIYGRGALDDKGPTIIILYCLKCLLDKGIKLNKKVRLIIGANEETGSACMDYYFNKLKSPQPDIAFTPDSNFPVTYAEKGIIRLKLKKQFKSLNNIKIIGGNAFNSVPDLTTFEYHNEINVLTTQNKIDIMKNKIISNGKSAHAAKPHLGYNSISYLFQWLSNQEIKNAELKGFVNEYNNLISTSFKGEKLNINCKDESGELTLNNGMINLTNNELEICLDIRCPVHKKLDDIINLISLKTKHYFELELISKDEPLYVEKNSFLVQTLMKIYKDITNDVDAEPIAIGGGTYARFLTNGVAFGALLKDQVDNMHQRNEYLEIDKIDELLKIYIQAIYELAK